MKITMTEFEVTSDDGQELGRLLEVQVLSDKLPDLRRVRAVFSAEQTEIFDRYREQPVAYVPSCPHRAAESGYKYRDTFEFEEK